MPKPKALLIAAPGVFRDQLAANLVHVTDSHQIDLWHATQDAGVTLAHEAGSQDTDARRIHAVLIFVGTVLDFQENRTAKPRSVPSSAIYMTRSR